MAPKVLTAILGMLISLSEVCSGESPQTATYEIRTTWDNQTVSEDQFIHLVFSSASDGLAIEISAPFYNDPPPPGNPGSFPGLWKYEVVEAFFLGPNSKYLELEFGPSGHYLAYYLEGIHNITKHNLRLPRYESSIVFFDRMWTGKALIPAAFFPPGVNSFNAFAIHGVGEGRTYMSLFPVGFNTSASPDFHRLDAFQPIDMNAFIEVTPE